MTDLNLMAENIRSVLEGTPGIKQAFDYEPQSITNLPAATVFFDRFEQSDQTTRRNMVNWFWNICIYIPMKTSDIKAPQVATRTFTNEVMKQFRGNYELGGTCLYNSVSSGEVLVLLEQNNPMLVLELTLEATTEES
jgi:hypothetical protein